MEPHWYERHVLPWLVDLACGMRAIRRQRQKVVPLARGLVLEVGIGTGLNLAHYDKARVQAIVGLDPGVELHPLARRRNRIAGLDLKLIGSSAERIPCDSRSFDTVLVTYSLCTISDPLAALREMRRVLKPEGHLLFCEHGRAPEASVRRWQDRLTPAWAKLAGGCHLNRDIPALLVQAGFDAVDLQQRYLPGPRAFTYNFWGTAVSVRDAARLP